MEAVSESSRLKTISEYLVGSKGEQKVFPSEAEGPVDSQNEGDIIEVFDAPSEASPPESEQAEPSQQSGEVKPELSQVEQAEFSHNAEKKNKLPKDKGFRFLFWSSWGFILVAIVILIVGIIWISICKGTTFGAYAPLLFIAAFIMAGVSALNIMLLCHSPNQVFCHGVLALVTFLVFLTLLILGFVVGGFHFFTINMEYGIFKMDFDLYQEKLKLDTFDKIKKVDDGYFWMAFAFGIATAVVLLATFVFASIACCHYLRCHYFVPLFCGLMPFMVGVFGMVFSISLGSLTAMTYSRFSFVYKNQGWWIFFMGLTDFLVSFLMLGCFFGITCKSSRNDTIDPKATYPEEGFLSSRDRSDVLGKDYWTCKHEFCILMWLNVLVCTPVFVFILLNVVINGWANHDTPLPCYADQMLAREDSSSAIFLSASSFVSLASFSSSSSSPSPSFPSSLHLLSEVSKCAGPYLTPGCTYTPQKGKRLYDWESIGNTESCERFLNSAEKYSLGLRHVSKNDYTEAACTATALSSSSLSPSAATGAEAGVGRHRVTSAFRRISAWLARALHIKMETIADNFVWGRDSSSPTSSNSRPKPASSSSLTQSSSSLSLVDMLLMQETISQIENGNVNRSLAELAPVVEDAFGDGDVLANGELCYDYSKLVAQWKEDIESYGADMCWITGIAMLIPAAPILLLDVIVITIVAAVVSAVSVWCGCISVYYVRAIGLACCSGDKAVVDKVEDHGNFIVEYYHIEHYDPGFNCCVCCGLQGCCEFIGGFTACVLDCCLRDKWGCLCCDD